LVSDPADERVVRYLCPACNAIVGVDLALDEVQSSSSAGSFSARERRKTILVADDAETVLDVAGRLLREAGFNVILAQDGIEALQQVRERHPDLVLLDLLMPRMSGFDVLREIRQDERVKQTPVVAMSGTYKPEVADFLEQLGAQGFLDKQQLEASLIARTRQLLDPAVTP
jgi:chemosensory pili system protein ChpA (sensor histidine kinase/response regulator)